ncbi:MAG: cytochrome c-type biogenesis protein CcmH [Solirubrobacteraceae bacterium]|nr:cytochrome c-type biogenesis protein CcmH [Patulibacter sp.]
MRALFDDPRRVLRLPFLILVAGVALFFAAALGPAQKSDAQTLPKQPARASLTDIEDEVMCVVCGRPLSTSGGTAADDERAVIQSYIDRGLDKPQIKEQLVREFGKQVLVDNGSPIAGFAPIVAAVVGVLSIAALLRRRIVRQRGPGDAEADGDAPAGPAPTAEPTAADQARIDAELAERT